jgi:hypothetical protein
MNIRELGILVVVVCVTTFVLSTNAFAQQDPAKTTENIIQTNYKIAGLRAQVVEIETKKANLVDRIRQLDEQMLPENLERTTVAAGSTRPEELRENRRLQLETEKKAVLSQIDLLEQNRLRIEMSIATTTPKPPPAETTPAKTQNTVNTTQIGDQNVVNPATAIPPKPQVKPAKRYSRKVKRKSKCNCAPFH